MSKQKELPKIDLSTFILSVSAAAYMGLGIKSSIKPLEENKAQEPDLDLARQNIDLLELISEKTQGNRSQDEDRLIQELLFELRLKYVEESKNLKSHSVS